LWTQPFLNPEILDAGFPGLSSVELQENILTFPPESFELPHLVVVGNGTAGVACINEILRYPPKFRITVFGDRTRGTRKTPDDATLPPLAWYQEKGIGLRLGIRIIDVDPETRTVTGEDGSLTEYDALLLATGSTPTVPAIPGAETGGVHVLRSAAGIAGVLKHARPGLRTAVFGGGLLAIEAARALQREGCEVTVIHQADHLLERQLDTAGGSYLIRRMERLGMRVLLDQHAPAILGNRHVESIQLRGGFPDTGRLAADLAVIAADILPDAELGRGAGLQVNHGIVVSDFMETSQSDIFAAGECAEHQGVCYSAGESLAEQARVLAATITGNRGPVYRGSLEESKLTIMDTEVFSAGDFGEAAAGAGSDAEAVRYENSSQGIYRKLVLSGGKLKGVVLVGDASGSHRYMDWLRTGVNLGGLWRQLLFPDTGWIAPAVKKADETELIRR
jgi:nitrite reductase (NADH) large subunit